MLQGVDVWLNTPRRPLEASGTSGMKAAVNGVLNVSVLDGWWAECYRPETGWAIGRGEEYPDYEYQDLVDSQALYNLLENEVIPTFYERKNGDAPDGWIQMMKASMKMALVQLCTHRMVAEYNDRFYTPAIDMHHTITTDNAQEAKQRLAQRERINSLWGRVHIKPVVAEIDGAFRVGQTLTVSAEVVLGDLQPTEVDVELYYGKMKPDGSLASGQTLLMAVSEDLGNGHYRYAAEMTCDISGRFGYTIRVTPGNDDFLKFSTGLITLA
jgi:starch phosphorylase